MSALTTAGLTSEQLEHFAAHGWLVLESVLDEDQCQAYIAALDKGLSYHQPVAINVAPPVRWLENSHLHGDIFLDWFKLPGILEAHRQLMGVEPRLGGNQGTVTEPHPDRHERRHELTDPERWGWHRDFRPANGLMASDDHPDLVRSVYVGSVTYLTPASPENGVTAVLDGSHTLDGTYDSLKDRCGVVQAEAPAGSILLFSETLIHSAVPVVSETTRYVLQFHLCAPWLGGWPGTEIPRNFAAGLRDEEIRRLFVVPRGDDGTGHPAREM